MIAFRKLEVQLMVDHPELHSTELAKLLALPADESWNVGQSYKPSPNSAEQRYGFSRWALRAVADSLDELPQTIGGLVHRIQGIEQQFKLLPANATVSMTLFITETETVIGLGIDPEVTKFLARINAGIEISLVVAL